MAVFWGFWWVKWKGNVALQFKKMQSVGKIMSARNSRNGNRKRNNNKKVKRGKRTEIYCIECAAIVIARLTKGKEIYPHREDLSTLPFWKCDQCGNYVGCHHQSQDRTRPLGCIPNAEMKNARKHIHALLDPIWKNGLINRQKLYNGVFCTTPEKGE